MTKDEFISLLLYAGTKLDKSSNDGTKYSVIGSYNHTKSRLATKHEFGTTVLLEGKTVTNSATATVFCNDGGENYIGTISVKIYPQDNMSE
jgi:hypothetical protein